MSNKLSYASGASDKPLLGNTIGQVFNNVSNKFPDREALVSVHQNIRFTYAELAIKVNELAKALISAGLKKGDRIGIWSSNNAEWLLTQYAAAKAGVILVTINPAYRSHELEYVLGQSGCKGLVFQNQFKTSDYESMICEIMPEVKDAIQGEIQSSKFKNLTTVISMTSSKVKGIYNWKDFITLGKEIDDRKYKTEQIIKI
jgi:Acyl-CoA synthetases (AMP-forming)/AMP-acid ligases II